MASRFHEKAGFCRQNIAPATRRQRHRCREAGMHGRRERGREAEQQSDNQPLKLARKQELSSAAPIRATILDPNFRPKVKIRNKWPHGSIAKMRLARPNPLWLSTAKSLCCASSSAGAHYSYYARASTQKAWTHGGREGGREGDTEPAKP
eukprot:1500584-Rhodomonas_salina.1